MGNPVDRGVFTKTGYDLDAIGAQSDINLPRCGAEPDEHYRTRLITKILECWIASLAPLTMSWPAALTFRLREFGVDEAFELPVGQFDWLLIVDDRHVERASKAVYDTVPIGFRIRVIGASDVDAWRNAPDATAPSVNHVRVRSGPTGRRWG